MTTNKKLKTTKQPEKDTRIDFREIKFVIDNLTSEHMKAHDKKPATADEIANGMHLLAEEGAKISFKFDSYAGKGFLITATFDLSGYHNSGYAISSRGADFSDCASILLYKYFVVAERDLSLWDYGKEDFRRG